MLDLVLYRLKTLIEKLKSVGMSPSDWLVELCGRLIAQRSKTMPKGMRAKVSANARLVPLLDQNIDISQFTITRHEFEQNPAKLKQIISRYGLCLIEQYFDQSVAHGAAKELKMFFSGDEFNSAFDSFASGSKENDDFLWQVDQSWSADYQVLAHHSKPVISIRSRQKDTDDVGMIDIFGLDKFTKLQKPNISSIYKGLFEGSLSESVSQISGYSRQQTNLYLNEGVLRTRGPHIDNNQNPFKVFLYLTDCVEEKNGPYCYLPRSVTDRRWMTHERLKNALLGLPSTEVSSFPRDNMVKLFAKAGTVVVSNQSGIHCGWPQSSNGTRLMLVSSYY